MLQFFMDALDKSKGIFALTISVNRHSHLLPIKAGTFADFIA